MVDKESFSIFMKYAARLRAACFSLSGAELPAESVDDLLGIRVPPLGGLEEPLERLLLGPFPLSLWSNACRRSTRPRDPPARPTSGTIRTLHRPIAPRPLPRDRASRGKPVHGCRPSRPPSCTSPRPSDRTNPRRSRDGSRPRSCSPTAGSLRRRRTGGRPRGSSRRGAP